MDFRTTDYEQIFNNSTRSKQVVFYMDSNTESGEIINNANTNNWNQPAVDRLPILQIISR